ncbi:MAG: glycoside hydrolase family 18 protein [Chloroflexota bacterium]
MSKAQSTIVLLSLLWLGVACATEKTVTAIPTSSPEPTRLPTATVAPTATATLTPAPTPTPRAPAFRLIAYLAAWSTAPSRGYRVADIPADKLTHLNYAFASVSPQGECVSGDANADARNFPELQKLKRRFPRLKILISIGGAGAQNFANAAKNADARQKFARSCLALMKQNSFDGIDVDWEFPKNADEKQNYAALLAELRAQLDTRDLLTIAAPAGPDQYTGVAWDQIARDLDWINLMTYDFAGPWSAMTGLNAPLYASRSDPSKSKNAPLYNGHAATQAYIAAGVPPDKIVFGAPFYGRGWKEVPNVNNGLFQKFNGVPQGTRGGGAFDYRDLKKNYLPTHTRYWDAAAQAPWLYNPTTQIMISYDDPESLARKAEYVTANKLGGVMIWEISTDDEQGSLINALSTRLR